MKNNLLKFLSLVITFSLSLSLCLKKVHADEGEPFLNKDVMLSAKVLAYNFDEFIKTIDTLIGSHEYEKAGRLIDDVILGTGLETQQKFELVTRRFDIISESNSHGALPKYKKFVIDLLEVLTNEQRAVINLKITKVLLKTGNYADSIARAKLGISLLSNKESELLAELNYYLAVAYVRQDKMNLGLEHMFKAMEIRDSLGLEENVTYLNGIGAAYGYIEDFEKSNVYLERAIKSVNPDNPKRHLIEINLSANFLELGQFDLAVEHGERAIAIANKHSIESILPYMNIGDAYAKQGLYDKALEYLTIAYEKAIENNQQQWLPHVSTLLGNAYLAMGNVEKSITLFNRAYKLFSEKDLRVHRLELYPLMIEAYKSKDDYEKAYNLLLEFKSLSDETRDLNAQKHQNELKTNFDLRLKEDEVALLEKEAALQKLSLTALEHQRASEKKLAMFSYVLIFILLLVSIGLITLLRYRQKVTIQLASRNENINQLNRQLKKQSMEDNLTGLHNRNFLSSLIEHENKQKENKRSRDIKMQHPWLLVLLDIDHFKSFNDKYGHDAGDLALQHFAESLKVCARQDDHLIRWGGEEFIWLCKDTTIDKATLIFERLQRQLANSPVLLDGEPIPITCSSGIASIESNEMIASNWQHILKSADIALYQAKNNGRDQCVIHQSTNPVPLKVV